MKAPWRLVVTLLLVMLVGGISWLQDQAVRSHASPHSDPAIVAIARASESPMRAEVNTAAQVEALVRHAVALAGGLSSVIHSGDDVVVKPNLVWDAPPDEGFTTDPRVVRALVRMAREAGAGQVAIAEGTAQFRDGRDERGATWEAFKQCGYDADGDMLDDETGAPLVDLNDAGGVDQHDPAFVTLVNIPNGLIWNSYWMPRALMEADVVIGVPVLKNHYLAGVTLSLKNQIGAAPSDVYHNPGSNMYKGQLSHEPNDLGRHMVDLNLARRLDFVVVDGLRGMTDGPTGGTLADPPMQLVLAGRDAVAVDTIGALVMGYAPATIPYLGQAFGAGLGTNDVSRIEVRGERVSQIRRDFPAPYGDPPAQRAESNAPTVHLTAPQGGWLYTTTVTLEASAQDDDAVAQVEFYVGSERVGAVTTVPYEATVDLSRYQGQTVVVRAVAYDRMLNDAQDSVSLRLVTPGIPGATTFQTTTLAIPTYNYKPFLQQRSNGPYTYYGLDWDHYESDPITAQPYTLLALENDYLRVTLLPELGGRVYQMIYKPTGHNELYQNPVVKPTHWGPAEQGWWLAVGGIEWALPVDEHGYEWGEPWAWSVVTSTAGVTVTVRDTQAADRLRAKVDLFLPADRAWLAIEPHLENPTASDLNLKFWLNAMLAPGASNTVGRDLRFVFNSPEMVVHSTGDAEHFGWCAGGTHTSPNCPFPWPFHEGVDFSRLGNWREWLGFFEHPRAAADFAGVYDTEENEGVARVFPSSVAPGVKGFGMGRPNSGYQIDPATWTDDGSTYVELHGGAAPAFWDWVALPAGQTLSWQEFWYPVSSIGVFSAATEEAALSFQPSGDHFNLGVHSTAQRSSSRLEAWDRATCALLGRWEFPIDPAQPFSTVLPMNGRARDDVSIMYLDGAGHTLAAIHPSRCRTIEARVQPLPPFVETTTFTVTWVKPEDAAGGGTFQVQARDGYDGAWADWLADTPAISESFTGEHGHTYFFRARTLAPNQGALGDAEWGQACTTVLTEAAPVLVTSRKTGAWSMLKILSDTEPVATEVVSYSLLISNTGNLAAQAVITDRLPAGLEVITSTLAAENGALPIYAEGMIAWRGDVPAGTFTRLSYALAPATIQRGERFTNTVTIEGSVLGPFTRQAVMTYAWPVWLPIVTR